MREPAKNSKTEHSGFYDYKIERYKIKIKVVENFGLFILPVKLTQNRQNKQRHFYSTGKIARRLSKSIVGWNIHMARSRNRKILSGFCAQSHCSARDAVIQRLTPQKHCNIFKNKVHVATNLRLCSVKFYLF